MGILSTIFGSSDIIKKGMDLIDDMHTSDVEMIEAKVNAKAKLLQSYAPFKIAQRYLAVMFSLTFIGSFILVLGMTLAGKGNTSDVKIILSDFYIGEIMITIVAFYFGGGFAEGLLNSKKKKDE